MITRPIISTVTSGILVCIVIFFIAEFYSCSEDNQKVEDFKFKPSELHMAYGGDFAEAAMSCAAIDDSNYVLAGSSSSFGTGGTDGLLIRIDQNGDVIWSRTVGENQGGLLTDVMVRNGFIYYSGYMASAETNDLDAIAGCVTFEGDSVWTITIGENGDDTGNGIYPVEDGSVLLTGYSSNNSIWSNAFFSKIDKNGQLIWSNVLEGPINAVPAVVQMNGDDIYVGGIGNGEDNGKDDVAIYKLSADGTFQTMFTFGTEKNEFFGDFEFTNDGAVLVGSVEDSLGADNMFLLKLDENLNIEWSVTMPTKTKDKLHAVEWRKGKGYYMAGESTNLETGQKYIFMVHTDKDGYVTCSVNLKSLYSEFPNDMFLSGQNELILAGQMILEENGDYKMMFSKAYDSGWDLPWKIKRLWLKAQPVEMIATAYDLNATTGPSQKPGWLVMKSAKVKDTCLFFNRELVDPVEL